MPRKQCCLYQYCVNAVMTAQYPCMVGLCKQICVLGLRQGGWYHLYQPAYMAINDSVLLKDLLYAEK